MSMSTLGQQLAAISNNNSTGTSYATSRRHDDAIGRGLAHSVQVGHAVVKNVYKPSVMYEDAKKASDVPLATIRENCVVSLRQLEEVDPEFGNCMHSLCKPNAQERGLLTPEQNETIDKTIGELIFRLSLRMSVGNIVTSGLHVVEYLLRKYDIHLRPTTASATLLAMLPHHEEPFFLRLLQLIDVANLPEWAFLRPYAVPGARLGRSVIAGQASKDVALLRSLGKLSQRNAKLPCCDKSLSFTAAVLVEALTLQTQRKGTMEEATCQALLPFVVAACRNHKGRKEQVWQNWGLILASTMVETGVLATEPRNLLVMSIFEGLARQKKILERSDQTTTNFMPLLSNGLTVALSLLMQETPMEEADSEETNVMDCRLAMLSPLSSSGEGTLACVGFSMAKQAFNILLRLDDAGKNNADGTDRSVIAACIGKLYGSEGIVEFKHWIASLLVAGWKIIAKTGSKGKRESHSRKVLHLLLSLIKQPDLNQRLWKDSYGSWIESYTSFVVSNTPLDLISEQIGDISIEAFALTSAKTILGSLKDLQKLPYERGVAHALTQINKKTDRMKCAGWLGLEKLQNKKTSEIGVDDEADDLPSEAIALPPRVALEHFDAENRLNAIHTLLGEYKSEKRMDVDDDGESIPQALFRRFLMDDDDRVALAAAEALDELFQSSVSCESNELGESALEAVHKWSLARNLDEKTRADLLLFSCRFASYACRDLFHAGEKTVLWVRLVEALGALLAHKKGNVSKEVESGIVSAFDVARHKSKEQKSSRKKALALLTSDPALLRGFRRPFRTGNTGELTSRRQLGGVVFESLASSPTLGLDVFAEAVEYCIWALQTFSDGFSETGLQNLSKFLVSSAENVATVPENIHSIASRLACGDTPTFEAAIAPFIKAVCVSVADKNGNNVVPLSVLMEITLASDDKESIENLVSVGLELAKSSPIGCYYAMAPAMSLTSNKDENVRALAVDLLSALSSEMVSKSDKEDWCAISAFGQYFKENKSSVVLEGATYLPRALSSVLSNAEDADSARRHIFNSLLSSVFTGGGNELVLDNQSPVKGWLRAGDVVGGYRGAVCLLQAMENAGERAFPLELRWEVAGTPILKALLDLKDTKEIPGYVLDLVLLTIRMLKGVKVEGSMADGNSTKSTVISSGPGSHGGRSRSYSFGNSNAVAFLRPYPKIMTDMILFVLESNGDGKILEETRKVLFEIVLSSKSWQQEVFSCLDNKTQQQIASGILTTASEAWIEGAEATLFSMPLNARAVIGLLSGDDSGEAALAKASLVYDYVTANSERLASDRNVEDLIAALFGRLSMMANAASMDEASKFARQALLNSLADLSHLCLKRGALSSKFEKEKKFESWIDCLLEILCGTEEGTLPEISLRSQKHILSILATFCDRFPVVVVPKYLRLIAACTSIQNASSEPKLLAICFKLALPVFLKHSKAADLTEVDLFQAFIESSNIHDHSSRLALYIAFAEALSTVSSEDASPIGSFVVAVLAQEGRTWNGEDSQALSPIPQLAVQILSGLNSLSKIDAVATMQGYSKQILFKIVYRHHEDTDDSHELLPIEKLCGMSFSMSDVESSYTYKKFCTLLTVAICDSTAILDLRVGSRKFSEVSTKLLLLWQDFLLMQSLCHSDNNDDDLRTMAEVIGQAMDWIQSCLPPHVYVAFTTNLMKEGSTEELQSRAVQLVAERCSSLTPAKPEAALFVEMVPTLVDMLDSKSNVTSSSKLLKHSSFAAIDVIGRKCFAKDTVKSKKTSSYTNAFVAALDRAAIAIQDEGHFEKTQSFKDLSVQSRQVVSSAAICASTAVKISGVRAVPALTKLMTSLLNVLSLICQYLKESSTVKNEDELQELNQARLVQLSVLRLLKSMVETLPLQLKQFLKSILTSVSQIPEAVETDKSSQGRVMEKEFNDLMGTIASCIPSRQVLPAVANAISLTSKPISTASLLMLATNSVTAAKSSEVSNQIKLVLEIAFHGIEGPKTKEKDDIMKASRDLILALVIKQSELQLRLLYKKLRIWRDDTDGEMSMQRKLAFWSISATLSKNLKTIFLPCLSMSFTDAVEELENCALALTKDSKKSSDGRKKQKLGNDFIDGLQMATMESLLACLEVSLRWDAHNGGAWIREMDSQRFKALLQPLGKLFQCCFPSHQQDGSYDRIVRGDSSSCGSVVGCMVALASAAGDEQLWKPLNHIVLQACSNSSRAEVRKAGISCLLSLAKSVGEEYMVLIPECLPVLAELLEDSDEEIAGLAQDCIALSEDLLGESLQDSLL